MLTKNIFRNEIKEILLAHMVQNKWQPGVRISLPTLASQLGVSTTPVREALTQLIETGIISYIPNRGFFVTELSKQEALEIYEIISMLEAEAIQKSEFTTLQIQQLHSINQSFKEASNPLKKLQKDMQFHQKLIENYTNQYAQRILENIRVRIFIYEHEFMAGQPTEASAQMHDALIQYLEAGDVKNAIQQLKNNWEISIQQIVTSYQSEKS